MLPTQTPRYKAWWNKIKTPADNAIAIKIKPVDDSKMKKKFETFKKLQLQNLKQNQEEHEAKIVLMKEHIKACLSI